MFFFNISVLPSMSLQFAGFGGRLGSIGAAETASRPTVVCVCVCVRLRVCVCVRVWFVSLAR